MGKGCRGTDERTYPWGAEADTSYANFDNDVQDRTAVGSYESGQSPYGLYDMAGDVWEWVADYYPVKYYQNSPLTNPLGPDSGSECVVRGGSWFDVACLIRTTVRNRFNATESSNNFGLRCATNTAP